MNIRVSAFMDGELESHEISPTFEALRRDLSLRSDWSTFHQIGEVLRREPRGSVVVGRDFGLRVLSALENEPTVLAPLHVRRSTWQQPLLALAASLAGIAVVGWVGFGGFEQAPESVAILNTGTSNAVSVTQVEQSGINVRPADARSLHAYVLAHQAHGSAKVFVGNSRYIRTVFSVNENR